MCAPNILTSTVTWASEADGMTKTILSVFWRTKGRENQKDGSNRAAMSLRCLRAIAEHTNNDVE